MLGNRFVQKQLGDRGSSLQGAAGGGDALSSASTIQDRQAPVCTHLLHTHAIHAHHTPHIHTRTTQAPQTCVVTHHNTRTRALHTASGNLQEPNLRCVLTQTEQAAPTKHQGPHLCFPCSGYLGALEVAPQEALPAPTWARMPACCAGKTSHPVSELGFPPKGCDRRE